MSVFSIFKEPQLCFSALILAIGGIGPALAGDFNEKTIVTFTAPVEIPGQALPAGTYVFKVLDSSTENNVVQVFDEREHHLYATFLAVPDHRMKPADKTIVMFEERPSDTPEAVRALFCRGDQYARLFVYPHNTAIEIARRSHQKVLQIRDGTGDAKDLKKADVTGVDESGQSMDRKDVVTPGKPNPK
jgi:hypothetical protein